MPEWTIPLPPSWSIPELTPSKFRITNVTRGKVDFELSIQKQHTVSLTIRPTLPARL